MDRTEYAPAPTTLTRRDWLHHRGQWLSRFRPATVVGYTRWTDTWVRWCDDRRLDPWVARRGDVEAWLSSMETRGLAPATAAAGHDAVRSFYSWLFEDELIDRDPTRRVRRPTVHVHAQRRTWLPPLRYAAFLEAAQAMGDDEHAVAVLGGMMGMRSGEMCSLDVADVQRQGGHHVLRYLGKGGKPALSPLPVPAQRAVLELAERRVEGPLLRTRAGTRLDTRSLLRLVRRVAAAAGVGDITPHGLRRTFATTGLANGVSERDMMLAGRWDRASTMDRYDMHLGQLDSHASHRIAGILSGFAG